MAQRKHVQGVSDGHDDPAARAPMQLRDRLRDFATARDWSQFHSPKNLAIAVSMEAAELLDEFQWLPDSDSQSMTTEKLGRINEAMADGSLCLIRLADRLGVDLKQAADRKIEANARRYPIDR